MLNAEEDDSQQNIFTLIAQEKSKSLNRALTFKVVS
jgi:hypothetical protein